MKFICKSVFVLLFSLFVISNYEDVLAEEVYYINDNGVQLTELEYNQLTQLYWDGYQKIMTLKEYEEFINLDVSENGIETVYSNGNNISLASVETSDTGKTLKMSKVCSSDCYISVTATWTTSPLTRSYDVIGVRFDGTSLNSSIGTRVSSSTETNSTSETKNFSNGFGASIKLPTGGNNVVVNQTYRVKTGGTIYASYQHANSSISLTNSKKYTISSSGYGKVFAFTGKAKSIYDKMSGVSFSV